VVAVRLYLVQHGRAKTEQQDPERPLTAEGVADVARVARHAIDHLGVRPGRVMHSGKTRARQTAEIWGRLLRIEPSQADDLAPNDDPATWVGRLGAETNDLMLVGHLPHLARLAAALVTGTPELEVVLFHQGGLVGLECTPAGWVVAIGLPPHAA